MKLPKSLQPHLDRIEASVSRWPISISTDAVVRWLLQFDPEDYGLGIRIVENLNVLGPDDIDAGLRVAYARLKRKAKDRETSITVHNTLFAAIGDSGKSGGMIAYSFRIANELPESNFSSEDRAQFLENGKVRNIVLVDDVVGTGRTAIAAASSVKMESTPLGVENVFVLAVCGFESAMKKVEDETGAHTFAAYTFSEADTVTSFDSPFYRGLSHGEREALLERLKYYNRRCSRDSELGYGSVGALLAFRHNPPNISVPVVWSSANGWNPLFPRLGRINGIQRMKADISTAQKNRKSETTKRRADQEQQGPPKEVTLLVEGRADEEFLEWIVANCSAAKEMGLERISVVALGGLYTSPRLFELIQQTGGAFVLVLEPIPHGRTASGWAEVPDGIPIVRFRHSVLDLLDLQGVVQFVGLSPEEGHLDPSHPEHVELLDACWRRLRQLGFGRGQARTASIAARYVDNVSVVAFLERLEGAVRTITGGEVGDALSGQPNTSPRITPERQGPTQS